MAIIDEALYILDVRTRALNETEPKIGVTGSEQPFDRGVDIF